MVIHVYFNLGDAIRHCLRLVLEIESLYTFSRHG